MPDVSSRYPTKLLNSVEYWSFVDAILLLYSWCILH